MVRKKIEVNNGTINEWLSEYSKPRTKKAMRLRLNTFLRWYKKPVEDLMKLSSKEAKHLVLKYQTEAKAKGKPNNTILSIITSVRALFKYLEKPLVFGRGRLLSLQEAINKHVFSNGDLTRMFEASDVRGKALISLGSSLGWAISDVLALDKTFIETQIQRANDNNETFVFFKRQRGKTNAKMYAIINPLAKTWLEKWLKINKSDKLFDISADQINRELQRIATESGINTLGSITFHCFRGWVFSSLVKSGFSEFEAKYVVGKTIPLSDATYLTLEESIQTKYKENYERVFNIQPSSNGKQTVALAEENKQLRQTLKVLLEKVDSLEQATTTITKRVSAIEKIVKPKAEKFKFR